MAGESNDPLSRLGEIAEEQLRWQRAAVLPQGRVTIATALNSKAKRQAYEMHDGQTKGTEIASAVRTSKSNLSGWTRVWRDLGIAYEIDGDGGTRIRHLASLRSLGLDLDPDKDGDS